MAKGRKVQGGRILSQGTVHLIDLLIDQRVQKGTEHAPLSGPRVEDQRGRCVVTYRHHLGAAVRKSRIQLQREVFSSRVFSLVMSFEGTMVLNADL